MSTGALFAVRSHSELTVSAWGGCTKCWVYSTCVLLFRFMENLSLLLLFQEAGWLSPKL